MKKSQFNLYWLVGLGISAFTASISPALAQQVPATPTDNCSWNWNRYEFPAIADISTNGAGFNPETYGVVRTASWYEIPNAIPLVQSQALGDGVAPAENTTGPIAEVFYGVGYFIADPGSTKTITLNDAGRNEGHAFAVFDTNGTQITRFPSGNPGSTFISSDGTAGRVVDPDGVDEGQTWTDSFSFTVPASGDYEFHYIIADEGFFYEMATSTACELPPEAVNDTETNNTPGTATAVDVLDGDTDADGTLNPATVTIVGSAGPGTDLVVPNEGTWSVNTTSGEITFTPDAGFTGDPTPIRYTVDDDDGNTSNEASVTIDYRAPPVASNDTLAVSVLSPVSIAPLTNDTGDAALDPTTVVLTGTGAPSGSTLAPDGKTLTVPNEGVWSVDLATGGVTFTPDAGFTASPTPASYVVSDTLGLTSNEAILTITVLPPLDITANNDGPITLNGVDGETSGMSVLGNDTLGGSSITDASLVDLTPLSTPTPASGSITLNTDGTVTIAPGTTAGTYTIDYEICEVANPTNCATAQVEVVVGAGSGLVDEIEDDLTAILEEDLTNTLTQQSNQIRGYSADALDRLRGHGQNQCLAAANLEAQNILFDVDKAILKPESHKVLDDIVHILQNCPASAFEIAGHTDSDASDAYNLDLSQRRVEAVLRALSARGLNTTGYVARGYGESQSIASNATAAGKALNRRVEFRALDSINEDQAPCDSSFSLARAFNVQANNDGVNADGQFLSDEHNCITDRREVFEGSLSFTDTGQDQTQNAINLSYRREQYQGSDKVFGYFVGLYASQSDVANQANGEIQGLGVNAGIYGARRLHNELFFDYYIGGAAGRHEFDLSFDRSIGTVSATGDYTYWAGFAGAALSGELEYGETTISPRIGFDYVYTPGADVDVIAELGALSEVGTLDLNSISGGRVFAEIRTDRPINNGNTNLWFNPRIACYQSLGNLDEVCGIGGSLGVEKAAEDRNLNYALELDGEWGEDFFLGRVTARASRQVGEAYLNGDAGLNSDGSVTMGANLAMNF